MGDRAYTVLYTGILYFEVNLQNTLHNSRLPKTIKLCQQYPPLQETVAEVLQIHTSMCILVQVLDKYMSVSTYMLRMNPSVQLENMTRDMRNGDNSRPPSRTWWRRVAGSLPMALLTPEAVGKMRSVAGIYKAKMKGILVSHFE